MGLSPQYIQVFETMEGWLDKEGKDREAHAPNRHELKSTAFTVGALRQVQGGAKLTQWQSTNLSNRTPKKQWPAKRFGA